MWSSWPVRLSQLSDQPHLSGPSFFSDCFSMCCVFYAFSFLYQYYPSDFDYRMCLTCLCLNPSYDRVLSYFVLGPPGTIIYIVLILRNFSCNSIYNYLSVCLFLKIHNILFYKCIILSICLAVYPSFLISNFLYDLAYACGRSIWHLSV